MEMRAIPSTGEKIPVIGMGTSGSFNFSVGSNESDLLGEVVKRFFAGGGRVIDTSPTYGPAEERIGQILDGQSLQPQAWLATKLSGVIGAREGKAQFLRSLGRLRTEQVALLQVHNLNDMTEQMNVCRAMKAEGRTRYTGLTHYQRKQQEELAAALKSEKPDFVQINYSLLSRGAEDIVFPVAKDLGIAVLANRTFEDGALFERVKGVNLPPWAREAGITSWAQAFLRFALSHPAVTAVIPATGKPERQSDNLLAGTGSMLTPKQRQSLVDVATNA